MFVLPSLSTFSRWPRHTMYGYSEYANCEYGNFLSPTEQAPIERPQKQKKIVSVPEKGKIRSNDIRLLFKLQEEHNKNQDKSKETNETIVID